MNVCDRKTPGEQVRAIQRINKKSPNRYQLLELRKEVPTL